MNNANAVLKQYLKGEFSTLLDQKYIDEWISAHLEYSEQRRVGFILGNLTDFIQG